MIIHAIQAIKKATQGTGEDDDEINERSVEISFVGPNSPFRILTTKEVGDYLKKSENFNPNNQMVIEWID